MGRLRYGVRLGGGCGWGGVWSKASSELWVWVGWGDRLRIGAESGWAEVDDC